MQYKVPQNIDLEDKIVGPFTMRQFVYLLVAGGLIYGWWNFLNSNYVNFLPQFLILAIPIGGLGFAFALVKINDRPFEYFVLGLLKFLFSPKQMMWKTGFKGESVIMIDTPKAPPLKDGAKDTRGLDDLAKSLEKQSIYIQKKESKKLSLGSIFGAGKAGATGKLPASRGGTPQTAAPRQQAASRTKPGGTASADPSAAPINLSVKDVASAQKKQAEAQSAPTAAGGGITKPAKSGGILGFLKR